MDESGDYWVVDVFVKAQQWDSQEPHDVTLATQCTSNHLHYVVRLTENWQGPVSVAVFTYDEDFLYTVHAILYFHLCHLPVLKHVTFHLSFPKDRSPEDVARLLDAVEGRFTCSKPPEPARNETLRNYVVGKGIPYPIGTLRNVALKNVRTTHVLNHDMDLMPSLNLRSSFIRDIPDKVPPSSNHSGSSKLAYIVPAVELNREVVAATAPLNKSALLEAWSRQETRPFWVEECPKCQWPTDYERWTGLPLSGNLGVAYTVPYQPEWEPYYIASASSLPLFDGRFKQFGVDRQSQVS